jgi:hypothetical protein
MRRKPLLVAGFVFLPLHYQELILLTMIKKWWLLGTIIFIIVAGFCGYYFYNNYQYKGSVEYSVSQLAVAFNSQNTVLIAQYFDVNSVVDNFWNGYEGELSSYSADQNALTSTAIGDQENTTKSSMLNGWQQMFNSKTSNETIYYSLIEKFFADQTPFVINGNTASKKIGYLVDGGVMYVFTFILTQQSDRTWKITDIQGMDDYFTRYYADNTRVSDLQAIQSLLAAYQEDNHTLPTPDSLNIDLTNTQFDIKYQLSQSSVGAILQDPLSVYGNKYIYAVDNENNPKYFVIEAKITHDNTTLAAQSEYTTTIFGVDCSFPSSFCLGTATTTATSSQ